MEARKDQKTHNQEKRAVGLVTISEAKINVGETSSGKGSCPLCSRTHGLTGCDKFQSMSIKERIERVKRLRCCFLCLRMGYIVPECWSRFRCGMDGYNEKHSKLLHQERREALTANMSNTSKGGVKRDIQDKRQLRKPIQLQRGHLTVEEKRQDGAAHSECEDLGQGLTPMKPHQNFNSPGLRQRQVGLHQRSGAEIRVKGTPTLVAMGILAQETIHKSAEVEVAGAGMKRGRAIPMPKVLIIQNFLTTLRNSVVTASDISRWTHLRGVEFPEPRSNSMELLIGQNVPQALVPLEVRAGRERMPFTVRTPLGWTVNEPVGHQDVKGIYILGCLMTETTVSPETCLERQVKLFWKLDNGDAGALQSAAYSLEDKGVLRLWSETDIKTNCHYRFPILFRDENAELPNNKAMVECRLDGLKRRLSKEAQLREEYVGEINKLLAEGYVESVPELQRDSDTGLVWYLPHHPVLNSMSQTKYA
ncbi:uncharacterized protein LOC121870340 [Homarus americanus]|uniref:uncharacterized protein LOC121870340 n=1 Tax=Homarus americanus TaxID=6706 RepID=UPI001C475F1E|nr:uncharacterized protein LOC121870340 [Homarus americanus]